MAKADREKLIDLLRSKRRCPEHVNGCIGCEYHDEEIFGHCDEDAATADMLIDNGVVFQNEKGCDYCQEDRDGYRTMFGAFSISNPFHGGKWFINTGHCKPRQIFYCPMCGRKLEKR